MKKSDPNIQGQISLPFSKTTDSRKRNLHPTYNTIYRRRDDDHTDSEFLKHRSQFVAL